MCLILAKLFKKYNKNQVILLYKVVSLFGLSRRIWLTAEPILFSITVKLLIGPGYDFKLFLERVSSPLSPQQKYFCLRSTFPPPTSAPRGCQERIRQFTDKAKKSTKQNFLLIFIVILTSRLCQYNSFLRICYKYFHLILKLCYCF